MRRGTFLKNAALAALTSELKRSGFSGAYRAAQTKRVAIGGIQIECSTYSRIRTRMDDFTVRRGQELARTCRMQRETGFRLFAKLLGGIA